MGHVVSPQNPYVEVLILVPQIVASFGDRIFKEAVKVK